MKKASGSAAAAAAVAPTSPKGAAAAAEPNRQDPPLQELSSRLQQLETSIRQARTAYVESLRYPDGVVPGANREGGGDGSSSANKASTSTPGSFGRFFRRNRGTPSPQKDDPSTTAPTATTPGSPSKKGASATAPSPSKTNNRLRNNTPHGNNRGEPEAQFVDIPDSDAFVENLRRVAELVVTGENFVTSLQKREDAAFKRSQDKWKAKRDSLEGLAQSGSDDTANDASNNDDDNADVEHQDDYMQLFDLFFERNALEMIINLITGATFKLTDAERQDIEESLNAANASDDAAENASGQPGDGAKEEDEGDPGLITPTKSALQRLRLETVSVVPPFAIATQALQSVSIMIQNVSRATSLFILLSNNLINDLINLPLDLYVAAERQRQFDSGHEVRPRIFASPEVSELTTHFVTFLKSLALRMNAQTLQFFLRYPAEVVNTSRGGDEDAGPPDESVDSRSQKSVQVEFPLYERSLEFCAAHQDSFVRVTAMNICLNTLRLTTISPPEEIPGVDEEEAILQTDSLASPDGILHTAKPLPFQERLAIAQHTCTPSRVDRLISPIFTKLAERWNSLDEQIREIDSNRGLGEDAGNRDAALDNLAASRPRSEKMAKAKEKVRRERLIRAFKEKAANMQDELLLLEDVFKVSCHCVV